MYHSATSLVPPLAPEQFYSNEWHEAEQQAVFQECWHLIGSASALRRPGDQLAVDLFGQSVVVRNFDGQLVAMRNVCTHRQCTLVPPGQGHAQELKCPFHGWVFGADGLTRRIPGATNFPHFDRAAYQLDRFGVATCGDLLFIRLSEHGISLMDWLGPLYEKFENWFSLPSFRFSRKHELSYPANWKIPVEISLESYHIPEVHPKSFAEDPGESQSEHVLRSSSTSFSTGYLTPRPIDVWIKVAVHALLRFLGSEITSRYEHHHVFPHVLVSHTDAISLAQVVLPTGPESSVAWVWLYERRPGKRGVIRQGVAAALGRVSTRIAIQILKEDLAIFSRVQQGVKAAKQKGLLGRCEERLFAFQKHVVERVGQHVEQAHCGSDSPGNLQRPCKSVSVTS